MNDFDVLNLNGTPLANPSSQDSGIYVEEEEESLFSICMLWLLVQCVVELLTVGNGVSLTLLPAHGILFLLLIHLTQP